MQEVLWVKKYDSILTIVHLRWILNWIFLSWILRLVTNNGIATKTNNQNSINTKYLNEKTWWRSWIIINIITENTYNWLQHHQLHQHQTFITKGWKRICIMMIKYVVNMVHYLKQQPPLQNKKKMNIEIDNKYNYSIIYISCIK